jgi:hypothetical protein
MHISRYVCMYACTRACMCTYCVFMYVYTYPVFMYEYVCIHVCIYMHVIILFSSYVYICIQRTLCVSTIYTDTHGTTHTHTHTHTHIHTNTQTQTQTHTHTHVICVCTTEPYPQVHGVVCRIVVRDIGRAQGLVRRHGELVHCCWYYRWFYRLGVCWFGCDEQKGCC